MVLGFPCLLQAPTPFPRARKQFWTEGQRGTSLAICRCGKRVPEKQGESPASQSSLESAPQHLLAAGLLSCVAFLGESFLLAPAAPTNPPALQLGDVTVVLSYRVQRE